MIGEVRDRAGERAAGARDRQGRLRLRFLAGTLVRRRRDLRHRRRLHRARRAARADPAPAALPLPAPRRQRLRAWRSASPITPAENLSTSEQAARLRRDRARRDHRRRPRSPRRSPGDDPVRAGSRRRPGSPTSARRSSGSRWSARRSRRTRAGAASSTGSTQPRVLVAIGAAALLLGAGAIFVSQQLLSDDERPQRPQVGADRPRRGRGRGLQRHLDQRACRAGRLRHRGRAATRWSRSPTPTPGFANTEVLYADAPEAGRAEGRRRPRGEEGGAARSRPAPAAPPDADVVVIAGEDGLSARRSSRVTLGAALFFVLLARDLGRRRPGRARADAGPGARGHRARRRVTRRACGPAGPAPTQVADHLLRPRVRRRRAGRDRRQPARTWSARSTPTSPWASASRSRYTWDGRTDDGAAGRRRAATGCGSTCRARAAR